MYQKCRRRLASSSISGPINSMAKNSYFTFLATNFQDNTFLTSTNVRFLIKSPIVGIKVFDGEIVKKRLQLTFESEGNFNMFANKVRQWLGINVQEECFGESTANSQLGGFGFPASSQLLSQPLPGRLIQLSGSQPQFNGSTMSSIISRSQPLTEDRSVGDQATASLMSQPLAKALSQNMSQNRSQNRSQNMTQNIPLSRSLSQTGPITRSLSQSLFNSQHFEPLTQLTVMSSQPSQPKPTSKQKATEPHSQSILASHLLAEFSEALNPRMVDQNTEVELPQHPQPQRDILSYPCYTDPVSLLLGAARMADDNETQYSQQDTMFQSTQIEFNDTQTSIISPELPFSKTANDAYTSRAITEEEINDAMADNTMLNSKRRSRKKIRGSVKGNKFEAKIAGAIKEVISAEDDSIHDLSDNQLALKLCRVMKSRSFLRLVKRVDSLLQSLPDDSE